MSVRPRPGAEVPASTARIARAGNPGGTTAMSRRRSPPRPPNPRQSQGGARPSTRPASSPSWGSSSKTRAGSSAGARPRSEARAPGGTETDLARLAAGELAAAGKPVSRRALRASGIKGSNQALNALALMLKAETASQVTPP